VSTFPGETTEAICSNCGKPYPAEGTPYRCPVCSGYFDFPAFPSFDLQRIDPSQPGIWRYRSAFGLPIDAPVVSLGEGNTPLIWKRAFNREIAFKLEFTNPSGAYKDRGSAVLVSFLCSRGVTEAVEDSSGNAGASYAAYAAAAGIQAKVFVPESASGSKRLQIEAYGAEVLRIHGSRADTAETALRAVDSGAVYASHAFMPQGLAGYATLSYEAYQQMGGSPGTVIAPVGQGGLLLGVGRGFETLQRMGLIDRLPMLVGVQALACAPLWALFTNGAAGMSLVAEGETLAEGVRVRHPLRGDQLVKMVRKTGGRIMAVDEPDILPGRKILARMGMYVEPTSAIVWNALEQLDDQLVDPIMIILTGSGLKSP
jgi:threonine synthase